MNCTASPRPKLFHLGFQAFALLAVAGECERHRTAAGAQPCHRVDQEVGTLDVPKLADIDQVGGVLGVHDRVEFSGGDAVEHASHQSLRRADGALIGVARKRAFEQEQVGIVHQRAFDTGIDIALQRRQRIVQRAAMGGVDPDPVAGSGPQTHEGAGLGAVTVQQRPASVGGSCAGNRAHTKKSLGSGSRRMAVR